jgi:hypothetical protein
MSLQDCVAAAARELAGDGASEADRTRWEADAAEIAARLASQRDLFSATGGPAGAAERLRAFARGKAEEARAAAAEGRRRAALNVATLPQAKAWVDAQVAKGVGHEEGLVSFLVGGVHGRDSVANDRVTLEGDYVGQAEREIDATVPITATMAKDPVGNAGWFEKVAAELHELGPDGKPGASGDPEAAKLAAILAKHRERMDLEFRRAGGNPGQGGGAPAPIFHETRVQKAEEKFVDDVVAALDHEASFGAGTTPAEARDAIERGYQAIVTGRDPGAPLPGKKGDRVGPGNVTDALGEHREWRFKDAAAWNDINRKYGRGNVLDAFDAHARGRARKVSLMRRLGPSYRENFERLVDGYAAELGTGPDRFAKETTKTIGKLKFGTRGWFSQGTQIGRAWAVVSGDVNQPTNVSRARFWNNARALVGMAKLGLTLPTQFSDLASVGASLHDMGHNVLGAQGEALLMQVKGAGADGHRVAKLYNVGLTSLLGDIHHRYVEGEPLSGRIARANTAFFKYVGVRWWTERAETALGAMVSHDMATEAGKPWVEVNPAFRHLLGLHGFTPERWEVVRQAVEEIGGDRHVIPGMIAELPDEAFHSIVGDRPGAVERERRDLEMRVLGFVRDQVDYGMIKGDDRTKMVTTQGVPPGSALGEVIRSFMQFKSFSIAYAQRRLARDATGYAGATPGQGVLKGAAHNIPAIATLVAASTFYGYLAMTVKDWLHNRTRKEISTKSVLAAMMQGGGVGLYGDFLFGEVSRFGGGLAESLAGPLAGEVLGGVELGMRTRTRITDYLTGQKSDANAAKASDWLQYALNNTPFLNMHVLRAALDIAILNRLQEMASPGTFRRRQDAMQKQFGQRYLLNPLPHGVRP